MDVSADLAAPCAAAPLFEAVDTLERYPQWLSIVSRAEPLPSPPGEPPAWSIDLRGRLGPFRRSKRLRMVRSVHRAPGPDGAGGLVVFERQERDGRHHSAWVLRAEVEPAADGARLVMHLHYDGSLWLPVLDRLLVEEIERSRPRLRAMLDA